MTFGTAFQVGTTVPSTPSAISGRRGSLVRIVACWRNGPPSPLPRHCTLSFAEAPGAMLLVAAADPPSLSSTSLTVQVQLVAPLVTSSGAKPVLRIRNSCSPVAPFPTVPK